MSKSYKQMTIPKSSCYNVLSPECKKQPTIKLKQTAETVQNKLNNVLIGCQSYNKSRTVLHISKVTCYDPGPLKYDQNPIFQFTPCWCIRFKNGRVASISKHLPYQGDCQK